MVEIEKEKEPNNKYRIKILKSNQKRLSTLLARNATICGYYHECKLIQNHNKSIVEAMYHLPEESR